MNEAGEKLADDSLGGNDKPCESGDVGRQSATDPTHLLVRTSHLRGPELPLDEPLVSTLRDRIGLTARVQLDPCRYQD